MKYKLTRKLKSINYRVPKGYRLIEDWELLKLSREDKKIKSLLQDSFLLANTVDGVRACRLYDFDSLSNFYAVGGFVNVNVVGLRGVLIKK